jgi:hypothetical protein
MVYGTRAGLLLSGTHREVPGYALRASPEYDVSSLSRKALSGHDKWSRICAIGSTGLTRKGRTFKRLTILEGRGIQELLYACVTLTH